MDRRCCRLFLLLLLVLSPVTSVRAQLPADAFWADGLHPAGLQGTLYAMRSHGGSVVVGGLLTAVGDRPVGNVARLEMAEGLITGGTPLGDGLDGAVLAFAEHEGQLVAGGNFTHSGGTPLARVARWDGAAWQPFGAGLPGVSVKSLAVYGGHLYAGAYRWDGQDWANVLQTDGHVGFLVEHEGLLYVGGSFTTAAGITVNNAFTWDGLSVQPLGSGLAAPVVGVAVVEGAVAFATDGGSDNGSVMLWEDGSWHELLAGVQVQSIAAQGARLVVSSWRRYAPYLYFPALSAWQDGTWSSLGGLISRTMIEHEGTLLLQAESDAVPGIVSPGLIAHDGAGFRTVFAPGTGCDDGYFALAPVGNGVIAGGEFRIAGGRAIDRVGLAVPHGWFPWGAGADLDSGGWFSDLAMVGAETYGIFTRFEIDITVSELCRLVWEGDQATWLRLPFGEPLGWQTSLVAIDSELYAINYGTLMRVALPVGLLQPLPGLAPDGFLGTACRHEGALVVGGRLDANGGVPCGHVLRRDGVSWEDLGHPAGALEVTALASLGAGGLAAAHRNAWGPARRVALYDGAGWQPLGGEFDDDVTHLVAHGGYLFAAGDFDLVDGIEAHGLAMWTGATWMPVGSGVTGPLSGRVTDLVSAGDNLWLCGSFRRAGGQVSSGLACWSGDPSALAALSGVPAVPTPGNVMLKPAWPNPFNPRTELAFTLPLPGQVRLSIHDARGARIRRLVDGVLAGGGHQSTWDGRDEAGRPVPSGSYFARLEVGSTVETGKLVLVR